MSEGVSTGGGGHEGSLAGATIDAFEVLGLLGRGGMGEVYQAVDTRLARPVALKIVGELYARDQEFCRRFEREARAASTLNHPNLAQVYFFGRFAGRPYFAMEFIKGRSLAEILRSEVRIGGFRCLGYLAQACEGLAAALARGIIHRDIKPANLMIDVEDRLKIVDFGLARRIEGDQTLTRTDALLGTPRYMSPEQAMAAKVDHRSDIYSLGATFYHLLAGTPPFDAETPLALIMCHVNEPLPPLKERNPAVPAQVCAIVQRMMEKRPEDRYQSYADLLAEIAAVRAGRVGVTDPSPSTLVGARELIRSVRGGRALRLAPWLTAATLALIVAVLLGSRTETGEPPGAGGLPEPAPSNSPSGMAGRDETGPEVDFDDSRTAGDSTDSRTAGEPIDSWSGGGIEQFEPAIAAQPTAAAPPTPIPTAGAAAGSPTIFDMAFAVKTLANLRRLSTVIQVHMSEHDEAPEALSDVAYLLEEEGGLETRDGWEREILYEKLEPRRFRLSSAGPDGLSGNDDDIVILNGRVIQGEPRFDFGPGR